MIARSLVFTRRLAVVLTAAAMACACDTGAKHSDGLIAGTVSSRERFALPPNALVELRLEDITRTDAPPTVLATQALVTRRRQMPIPFAMRYPQQLVAAQHRYGLSATIRAANGRLLLATTEPESVLHESQTGKSVELVLLPPSADLARKTPLPSGAWRLVSMRREDESVQPMSMERLYTIEFAAGGSLSGRAHCFDFTGRFTEGEWGQLSIFRLVAPTTRCPPPSRADEFIRSVDVVRHHEMRADQLVLTYGVGGELIFGRF